jgi:hypothetical protein
MNAGKELLTSAVYGGAIENITCKATKATFLMDTTYDDCGVVVKDETMYVSTTAVVDRSGNATWYSSNADAVAACDENSYVKLFTDSELILTKDLYDDEPWDVRIETGRKNGSELPVLHNYFYPNLTLWSYALLNACKGNEILMPVGDALPSSEDQLREYYETLPIARINCKKAVGGSRCKSRELNDHIVKYGDLILRQIRMYDPDIILCCCGDHVFKNFIKKEYLPDLQQITVKGNWAHYSPSANKLVINSFHPSYFGMSRKRMYEYMMEDVKVFLEKYPGFIKGD